MKIIKSLIPYVLIIVGVVLFRSFIATPVRVEGTSMDKYLKEGDILVLYRLGNIDRFDIVVLDEVMDNETVIKRVYGMPNETIEIRNNKIYINDEVIKDEYAFGTTSDYPKTTLGKDEYFLLGDNRLVSKDSRSFGVVKKENIKGVTTFRLFPFNRLKKI